MHVLLTIDAMCGRRVRQGNAGQIDEAVMSACLCEGTAMMLVLLLCSLREDLSSSKGRKTDAMVQHLQNPATAGIWGAGLQLQ